MATLVHAPRGPLPEPELRSVFYPMGFPVAIETNSPDVLAAAEAAWAGYPGLSQVAPVLIRIVVSGASAGPHDALEPSRVRFTAEWMSIDYGVDNRVEGNRAKANLAEGWGDIHLTADVACDPDYVRYHFLEPLAYMLLAPPHFAFIHASCVALAGRAAVLCGDSGAGKTSLAYACARRGWAFLTGDATHLLHNSPDFAVAGRPLSIRFRESARDLFPELAASPSSLRPNGQPVIEVDTDTLNLTTAFRSRASHLIFLERRSDGGCRVDHMLPAEAMRRLEENIFFGDENIRRQQRATLRRFADLPAFRFAYSNLGNAETTLRELITGGT